MNITLKSVPTKLHARLKEAAKRNGRSINTEAIAALEREYLPVRLDPVKHLELIRATQRDHPLRGPDLTDTELKAAIREGRE